MSLDALALSYLDWDKLHTFYYVAQARSFTEASVHLGLSQSAISRQIIELESSLNVKLFNRRSRNLALSYQGKILFRYVTEMKSAIECAQAELDQEGADPAGPLNIYTTSGFADLYLNPYISDFLETYPFIQLTILGMDVEPDLRLGEADVLIYPPVTPRPQLAQRPLMGYHMRLYASRAYLEKNGTPKKIQDLDNHRLIAYGRDTELFPHSNWLLKIGRGSRIPRDPYIAVNSTQGRFYLAHAGLGITTLPKEHPALQGSSMVEIFPEVEGPVSEFSIIYMKSQEKSKKLQVFVEWLEKRYKNK